MERTNENGGIPLCTDLDGTLLLTDVTWEALLLLIKQRPWALCILPWWALRGRAFLKGKIAEHAPFPDVGYLPFNGPFVDYLREEHTKGRDIVLVTGSHKRAAQRIADHLGIFSAVYGTEAGINLSGRAKARMLAEFFGKGRYDYAGNAIADLPAWADARDAIFVRTPRRVMCRTRHGTRLFSRAMPIWKALLAAVRPYQWLKNFLVFVPILTSHTLTDMSTLQRATVAFVAFCFVTSGTYLFNDLLDLSADRRHPRKRLRPLASGNLPIPVAIVCAPLLLLCGFLLSLVLPPPFLVALFAYIVAAFLYSMRLKEYPIADVLILAALYTLRVFAGAGATGIVLSYWLVIFSLFVFFSLALLKRYGELGAVTEAEDAMPAGRGYEAGDRPLIGMMGMGSGLLSVLVMALYASGEQVLRLYRAPAILWLILPLMLYWIGRMWLMAHRGTMRDDPVLFALKDPASYVTGALILFIMYLAA